MMNFVLIKHDPFNFQRIYYLKQLTPNTFISLHLFRCKCLHYILTCDSSIIISEFFEKEVFSDSRFSI